MKKNSITIFALLLTIISYAQTETFDASTYKAPKGWVKSTKEGVVTYLTSDETYGTYCAINIYTSIPTVGNAGEEFTDSWNELVATPFKITIDPETEISEDDGWEIISGGANFTSGQIESLALLTTFVGYGKTVNILFLTNDGNHQKDIEEFLSNLTIDKTIKKVASVNSTASNTSTKTTTATTSTTATTPSFKPSNNLEGPWMRLHTTQYYGDLISSGSPEWIVFFKNGRIKNAVPDDPATFDYNASDLGYYEINGGNAKSKWYSNVSWSTIKFKSNDQIEINSETYYRCKSVDGLKLDGTWTSYANPNDPSLDDGNGAKPMIQFSKNGSFKDYGIFERILDQTVFDRPPTPAGSGIYSINNFSLTLNYSNGTVRKISLTGLLGTDLYTNNKSIYLQRLRFSKRD
ncbi:MAG: hypothetical protein KA174_00935 [Chitinophagales bacterium]|jgi:hypothetical protein|nr:hypothetical protein [Chitinophagales bacterium]